MLKRRLLTLFIFLTISTGYGQNHKSDCRKFIAGCFLETRDNDTLILFRGLQYWIEADVRHHTCKVYKISWDNSCSFTLQNELIIRQSKFTPIQDPPPPGMGKTFISFLSSDSNSITFNYSVGHREWVPSKITLKPIYDTDSWRYLTDADSLLYTDTSEIKKLYGYPEQNFYDNVPDFIKSITDTAETRFADYIFSLLEEGDLRPAWAYASPVLKKNSDESVLADYNSYIQYAFGKLINYRVLRVDETFMGIKNRTQVDNIVLEAQFAKVKPEVKLCLSVAKDNPEPLITVNVIADSANQVTFMDSLTSDFWMLLKNHDYRDIYFNSSPTLQSNLSYEEAKKSLMDIYTRGHLNEYRVFFQTFSVNLKKGTVVAGYTCTIKGKTYQINLVYALEEGKYKLAGLNAPEN